MLRNNWQKGGFNLIYLLLSAIGGLLLALTGLSIGWMVGTLIASAVLSLWRPKWIARLNGKAGLEGYWLRMGQLLLGVQIGEQINQTIVHVFAKEWPIILFMLIVSIALSLLSGWLVYRYSQADLVTSLYGTTPGGLSSMLGIAADVGANMAVVSIIQTLRVILVVGTIPLCVSLISGTHTEHHSVQTVAAGLNLHSFTGLLLALFLALAGSMVAKKLHFPAPWLLGSMLGLSLTRMLSGPLLGDEWTIWWPREMIIAAQIMIGATVGARLNRKMFAGLLRTTLIGFISSVGLTLVMLLAALIVSRVTSLGNIATILAFAPGGIAEMAATSVVLHADPTFVVTVQVLRMLSIVLLLPPFFAYLHRHSGGPSPSSKAS
ncbi:MAG: AbrB family transcriptional regulator [Sporolactobacillus sp.]